MNGIVINIDPVLFHIGALELRWYSLAIITAVVAAVLITARQARKRGIASESVYSLALWVIAGGIIGARLFHVIDRWEYYLTQPSQILSFQQGGLAIWGAMAGGGLALVVSARSQKLPLARLVDAVTPGLLVAQMIGRIGCVINGDAYGGVTDLPWAFIYIHPGAFIPDSLSGLLTHPYPVYEIIWNAVTLLLILGPGRHFGKDGLLVLSYLSLYSAGRFVLTFVRQEKIILWGLQQAQLVALGIIIASVVMFLYLSIRAGQRMTRESQDRAHSGT